MPNNETLYLAVNTKKNLSPDTKYQTLSSRH